MKLADLKPGMSGIITAISQTGRLSARLMELGMVPGATVDVMRKAPFGDPVQYRVRGAVISMRVAEAACVAVCSVSAQTGEAVVSPKALVAG